MLAAGLQPGFDRACARAFQMSRLRLVDLGNGPVWWEAELSTDAKKRAANAYVRSRLALTYSTGKPPSHVVVNRRAQI